MSFLFNLEELILEEQALQKIVELEIVNCRSLKVLTGLENLKTPTIEVKWYVKRIHSNNWGNQGANLGQSFRTY